MATASDPPAQLRRILSRRDVLAIAFGAMVGWSWVVLAGEMIVRAGALGSVLALVVGAVMSLAGRADLRGADLRPAQGRR